MSDDKDAIRCAIGISGSPPRINLVVGDLALQLDEGQADALAVDLMRLATELRSGGALHVTSGGWDVT